ncbi:hypothetical protein KEM52_003527, partial [Ascosphaera acerosa]
MAGRSNSGGGDSDGRRRDIAPADESAAFSPSTEAQAGEPAPTRHEPEGAAQRA